MLNGLTKEIKMATHNYKCPNEHIIEHKYGLTEERPDTIVCATCGEDSKKTFGTFTFILNGTGWAGTAIPRSAGAEIEGLTG